MELDRPVKCPVVAFDHTSAAHSSDPVAAYRAVRETAPIVRTEAHGGYFVATDYDTVFHAARTEDIFSSARSPYGGDGLATVIPKVPVHLHIPVELDPPHSREYRKILNPVTAPAAIERVRPRIQLFTTWFVDQVIEQGECDLATVIGVPAVVTLDWLGLPTRDWQRYSRALHAVLADRPGSPAHTQAVTVDIPWMTEQVRTAIAVRRKRHTDDIIGWIVRQDVDGAPISDNDAYSMVELLISGGVGTTASLVSQALVWLYQHPVVRQRLIDDPSLLDKAVEEFLRYFSPTQALARTVTRDTELGGCPLQQGDRILLAWASANRDAKQFDDPDTLDIERWPNRHTGFGIGVHRCAGSHLGRAMARELIGQVIRRMPDYEVDLAASEAYRSQGVNSGWQRIPTRFTPGPRVGPDLQL